MKKNKILRAPLKSWDIFSESLYRQAEVYSKQTEIEILNNYKEKFGWVFDVETVLNNRKYEALILTNSEQEIQWVNKGFAKMTGYPVSFSKGKTPKFLQGENSSISKLKRIRENIKKRIHFKETIVNYRKNGEAYGCNIEIYPLCNSNNKICHLLALDKEDYTS